ERTSVAIELPAAREPERLGTKVSYHADGRVASIKTADGKVFQYTKYADDGELTEFIDPQGVKHENTGPSQWKHTLQDGTSYTTAGYLQDPSLGDPSLVGENYYVADDGTLLTTKIRGDGKHTLEVHPANGKPELRTFPSVAAVHGLDLQ